MLFTIVDVVLLMVITAGTVVGAMLGLIQAIGALIGIGAGVIAVRLWADPVGSWLAGLMLNHQGLARSLSFILIFGLTYRLVGLAFYLLDRSFKLISWLPFIGSFNKLLGGIFGLLESILACAVAIYMLVKFVPAPQLIDFLDRSMVAHFLLRILESLSRLFFA